MKTIVYRRHSLKKGNHISALGLSAAAAKGKTDPLIYDKIVGGSMARTYETLLAYILRNGSIPEVLEAHDEFGDQAKFDEWGARGEGWVKEIEKAGSAAKAFQAILTEAEMAELQAGLADGFRALLDQVGEGQTALAIGHSPMIELTMVALGLITIEEAASLKELEGYVVDENDGKLSCERIS